MIIIHTVQRISIDYASRCMLYWPSTNPFSIRTYSIQLYGTLYTVIQSRTIFLRLRRYTTYKICHTAWVFCKRKPLILPVAITLYCTSYTEVQKQYNMSNKWHRSQPSHSCLTKIMKVEQLSLWTKITIKYFTQLSTLSKLIITHIILWCHL